MMETTAFIAIDLSQLSITHLLKSWSAQIEYWLCRRQTPNHPIFLALISGSFNSPLLHHISFLEDACNTVDPASD
jgi:hypothetical protein